MTQFAVTEQRAVVIEVTYHVEADHIDDVENQLDRAADEVHRETIRSHIEITGVEAMDDGRVA